jgi:four helix bundle protein
MSREKLVVEIKSEQLLTEIARLLKKTKYACNASIHLEKSGDSVYFNLGEGAASFKPLVKAAKYDIARREASEVQRALRALVIKGKLTELDIALAHGLADEIIAMLTTMIKNLEDRSDYRPEPSVPRPSPRRRPRPRPRPD